MNLIEAIAHHLAFEGFGTVDTDIFWGRVPDTPDTMIAVLSTDSGVGGVDSTARIQLVTRSKKVREAYETAYALGEAFDGFVGFLHGDGPQAETSVVNCAAGLGADAKNREMFSTNISLKYCN